MHVQATVTSIDLNPEFGDIFGTEAVVTVSYADPRWSNAPRVTKTLELSKAEAEALKVGQTLPVLG